MCTMFFNLTLTLFIQSLLITWLFVIYWVQHYFPTWWIQLLVFFTLLLSCRHLTLVYSDPGTVPRRRWPPSNQYNCYYCYSCRSWSRAAQSQHCRRCNLCVKERDHHCIVIGNCVGQNNRRIFVIFLLESCVTAFLACCTLSYLASTYLEIRVLVFTFSPFYLYVWSAFLALVANILLVMFIEQIVLISNCLTRIQTVRDHITCSQIPRQNWVHLGRLSQVFGLYPWDWFTFW